MIAVTGANGLLGSYLIKNLVAANQPCVAIVRENSDTSLLREVRDKIEVRFADILDPVKLRESFGGITKVIHTAAIVSFNPRRRNEVLENNVTGTRNVVNQCLEQNISRFVHVSSVAALGRQKGQSMIDENNKWIESALNGTYAESKYLSELEVFRGQEEGLSTVIVNPSIILAPANWNKSSAQLFRYVWEKRKFYIDSGMNYVDVRDVSSVIISLLDDPSIQGERFIVSGGQISFFEFFQKVAERMSSSPPTIKLSGSLLQVVAFVESVRARIAGIEPIITRETALMAGNHFTYDNQKIKQTLNFDFQSVDNTLDWCCSYYLNYIQKK
jgi:dihydroflavonol-4-reductase